MKRERKQSEGIYFCEEKLLNFGWEILSGWEHRIFSWMIPQIKEHSLELCQPGSVPWATHHAGTDGSWCGHPCDVLLSFCSGSSFNEDRHTRGSLCWEAFWNASQALGLNAGAGSWRDCPAARGERARRGLFPLQCTPLCTSRWLIQGPRAWSWERQLDFITTLKISPFCALIGMDWNVVCVQVTCLLDMFS